ncbi:hypothetical protein BTN49_2064 [Candidatus Enterovibrio escicola]|uniref:Uncharacterized protein n=1 Tax=Candidatus Enterovibrio escicola TaxID=1927127 RepID=A0A2A5T2D8_9GAMM|nr:hypothetical protein BTN49_2064 [Candidatus Enterovibrio escacola]
MIIADNGRKCAQYKNTEKDLDVELHFSPCSSWELGANKILMDC